MFHLQQGNLIFFLKPIRLAEVISQIIGVESQMIETLRVKYAGSYVWLLKKLACFYSFFAHKTHELNQ